MRLYLTLFVMLLLFVIAFIFGSQNNELITLNYMLAKVELSIAQAVTLFVAIGFVLGLLTTMVWRISRRMKKAKGSA